MGLLTIIRKVKRKEKEMRIFMVGLDNAGKTTIVKRINGEDTTSALTFGTSGVKRRCDHIGEIIMNRPMAWCG